MIVYADQDKTLPCELTLDIPILTLTVVLVSETDDHNVCAKFGIGSDAWIGKNGTAITHAEALAIFGQQTQLTDPTYHYTGPVDVVNAMPSSSKTTKK